MLNHMLVAVNAVLPSFLIIALGLFVRRRGMLDDTSLGKFNSVAFRVFLPFQIFKNIYDAPIGETFDLKLILFIFFGLLAAVATPLCLFILGGSFAPAGIRGYAKSLWLTVAFKLVVIPGLALAAAAAIGIRGIGLGVVMMSFGAPTAVNSYTMARELGGDGDLAASIVVFSSALSCLSLFGWIVLLKALGLF